MYWFRLLILVALIMGLGACAFIAGIDSAATNEELMMPEGVGPFPAVIILHTMHGLTAGERTWANRLVKAGYAALIIDSGYPAGRSIEAYHERTLEVKRAIARLQSRLTIKGDRIALLGRSHGAGVALLTLDTKIEPAPRAIVSIFPRCSLVTSWKADIPVLYLLGGADFITPAEECERIATHLARKGKPVRSITYPESGHFFDTAGGEADRQAELAVLNFLSTHLGKP